MGKRGRERFSFFEWSQDHARAIRIGGRAIAALGVLGLAGDVAYTAIAHAAGTSLVENIERGSLATLAGGGVVWAWGSFNSFGL